MFMNSHEEMANFNTYVLTPMSFLCATFFSTDRLPSLMYYFVESLPLTHASHALRMAGQNQDPAILSIVVLLAYFIVFLTIGIWQMKRVKG